jgi:hypothetical protein
MTRPVRKIIEQTKKKLLLIFLRLNTINKSVATNSNNITLVITRCWVKKKLMIIIIAASELINRDHLISDKTYTHLSKKTIVAPPP